MTTVRVLNKVETDRLPWLCKNWRHSYQQIEHWSKEYHAELRGYTKTCRRCGEVLEISFRDKPSV